MRAAYSCNSSSTPPSLLLPLSSQERGPGGEFFTLQFSIQDTGPGIAPDDVDRVFDAFVQSDSGRQSQEGTGLGLPISRKFVQMMGGDMMVASEVGSGSVFSFWIQAEAVEGAEIEPAQPERRVIALEPDQPRYRILIVDDRETNRLLLLNVLRLLGADTGHPADGLYPLELREAAHGQEALKIWEVWEPHLIFMDMRMPVMDGYEATKAIRNYELGMRNEESESVASHPIRHSQSIRHSQFVIPHSKIIAVTANVFDEERSEMRAAGCDDVVRKPFIESQIFDALRRHLGVRFVYDTSPQAEVKDTPDQERDAQTVTALAALPANVTTDLEQALLNIDLDRAAAIIEQIRAQDARLADTLQRYVDDFKYEKILTLIQETASQNGR